MTSKAILYVLSRDQIEYAKGVELKPGIILRLSTKIPKGALFAPIRYNKERKSYVVPAIGKIVLVMPTLFVFEHIEGDADLEAFGFMDLDADEDENLERIRQNLGDLEALGLTNEEVRTWIRNVLRYRHLLKDVLRRAPERVRRFLFEEDVSFGFVLILAETLICFTEDVSVTPINAPMLDRDLVSQLLKVPDMSHKRYTRELRSLRGFVGEDACRIIYHLLKQRLPCITMDKIRP